MKRWYVIQVYAGYEDAVKKDLEREITHNELTDLIGEILIPSAKLKQFFSSVDTKDEQLFPGYMLVEMDDEPQAIRLIKKNPRVIRFLGGDVPVPLSQAEINRILSQMKGEVVYSSVTSDFSVGNEVEIKEGPFSGWVGLVDYVDQENERLTVMVTIFGRMTPVELGFSQVKQ
jgi:transcription termination/antitermination protein NusG